MVETVLEIRGVAKHFGGFTALSDIHLQVGQGERLGLIGPNGSGKTTLLNLLTGLVAADDGSVTIDRARLDPMAADQRARAGLARGFQHPEVDGEQTVWAAVMAAQPLNRSMARARAQGAAALVAMDLGGWSRAINDLTPAECRRLDIARALAKPTISVLSGEQATFSAGGQIPIAVTVDTTTSATSGTLLSSTVFADFGVNVSVRPLVDDDDMITLDVTPSISQPDFDLTADLVHHPAEHGKPPLQRAARKGVAPAVVAR